MSDTNVEISKEARECAERVATNTNAASVDQCWMFEEYIAEVAVEVQQAINAAKKDVRNFVEAGVLVDLHEIGIDGHTMVEKISNIRSTVVQLKEENERLREDSSTLVRSVEGYFDNLAVPIGPQSVMTKWVNESMAKLKHTFASLKGSK